MKLKNEKLNFSIKDYDIIRQNRLISLYEMYAKGEFSLDAAAATYQTTTEEIREDMITLGLPYKEIGPNVHSIQDIYNSTLLAYQKALEETKSIESALISLGMWHVPIKIEESPESFIAHGTVHASFVANNKLNFMSNCVENTTIGKENAAIIIKKLKERGISEDTLSEEFCRRQLGLKAGMHDSMLTAVYSLMNVLHGKPEFCSHKEVFEAVHVAQNLEVSLGGISESEFFQIAEKIETLKTQGKDTKFSRIDPKAVFDAYYKYGTNIGPTMEEVGQMFGISRLFVSKLIQLYQAQHPESIDRSSMYIPEHPGLQRTLKYLDEKQRVLTHLKTCDDFPSVSSVANKLDISQSTVQKILVEEGFLIPPPPVTRENVPDLLHIALDNAGKFGHGTTRAITSAMPELLNDTKTRSIIHSRLHSIQSQLRNNPGLLDDITSDREDRFGRTKISYATVLGEQLSEKIKEADFEDDRSF